MDESEWTSLSSRNVVQIYVDPRQGKPRSSFPLPSSLELNLDELVWNDVENSGVGRALIHCTNELRQAVVGRPRHLQKFPAIVRSFLQAPDARDAALPLSLSSVLIGKAIVVRTLDLFEQRKQLIQDAPACWGALGVRAVDAQLGTLSPS